MARLLSRSILLGGSGLAAGYFSDQSAIDVFMPTVFASSNETSVKCTAALKTLEKDDFCDSLLKRNLSAELVKELSGKQTKLGGTLWDVIQSGVNLTNASVGVLAPDAESYKLFDALFEPIIEQHHGTKLPAAHPESDLSSYTEADDVDELLEKHILNCRVGCRRSLKGMRFLPTMNEQDYMEAERKLKEALESIEDKELHGHYHLLDGLSKKAQFHLGNHKFLFDKNKRQMEAGNCYAHWPKGRGIYHNRRVRSLMVWVNESDHLRIVSIQKGAQFAVALDRLNRALKAMEEKVEFERSGRLGWLTVDPSHLGSGFGVSVCMKLPKLAARTDLQEYFKGLNLNVQERNDESLGQVLEISLKSTFGINESTAIKSFKSALRKLIEFETKC